MKQQSLCGDYNMVDLLVAMEIQFMHDNHTTGCCIMQKQSSNICFYSLNEITKWQKFYNDDRWNYLHWMANYFIVL